MGVPLLACGLAGSTLLLPACSTPTPADRLATLTNPDAAADRRIDALHHLGPPSAWPEPARAQKLLTDLIWSDRQTEELRLAAIDHLAAHDPDTLRGQYRGRITLVEQWPVLQHLFDTAVSLGWTDTTPALIRSYARTSQRYADADRPERAALAALHPGRDLSDLLAATLAGSEFDSALVEQAAAWTLIARLNPPADARRLLLDLPDDSPPLVADLRTAADLLDVLPPDTEGVLWLMALRAEDRGRWWQRAAQVVADLPDESRPGLELRHLPILLALTPEARATPRDAAVAAIRSFLASHPPHATRTEFGAVPGPETESFDDQLDQLAWADLITIRLLTEALDDPSVIESLFAQADADLADDTTEHGGVLALTEDHHPVARAFDPVIRAHNHAFYASPDLIAAMYAGLAHYHFHAQRHDNAPVAGPGGGDLAFVQRLRPSALVFTFLDENTLNADYHQPGNLTIDLGSIRRPSNVKTPSSQDAKRK